MLENLTSKQTSSNEACRPQMIISSWFYHITEKANVNLYNGKSCQYFSTTQKTDNKNWKSISNFWSLFVILENYF